MMVIINLILIILFLVNYFTYWLITLKVEEKNSGFIRIYNKIYLILWSIPVLSIPILNSSHFYEFNNQFSYFQSYWIWFLILGIIFIAIGIKLGSMYINKRVYKEGGVEKLNMKGAYGIVRHPEYTDWALTFIGLAFIFDSFISLVIIPFFMLLLKLQTMFIEKYILEPKFGENLMKSYRKKTPYSLLPSPYNWLLIIIAGLVIYIGVLNLV